MSSRSWPTGPMCPIYVGDARLLEKLTGYNLHRGALAAMHRPPLAPVADLIADARRIVILEDIVDHTNVGAIFRSVAGLGADAVLITPRCADPLYRRSVRVSMGTVLQVPWTRLPEWAEAAPAAARRTGSTSPRWRSPTTRVSRSTNSPSMPAERLALDSRHRGRRAEPTSARRRGHRRDDPDAARRRLAQRRLRQRRCPLRSAAFSQRSLVRIDRMPSTATTADPTPDLPPSPDRFLRRSGPRSCRTRLRRQRRSSRRSPPPPPR